MRIKQKLFNAPLVLSFGSGAGKILSKVSLSDECYKVAVNSSERDLSMIENKVDVVVCCGSGRGSAMEPEQGRKDLSTRLSALFSRIDEIRKETKAKDIDLLPVIFSLGHGFGSGSLELALSSLQARYKNTLLLPFVITPFTWEGVAVIRRAYEALSKGCKINTCFVISNEQVGAGCKDISASYDKINSHIGNLVSIVVKAFSAADGLLQTVDKSDLTSFLSGDLATVRHLRMKSADDLGIETLRHGLGDRWLKVVYKTFKPAPPKLKVFYILDGRGSFSILSLEAIQQYLADKECVDKDKLKPLLIQRNKDCDFVWMESGFALALDTNIYGIY
jgi:cell division GTPase FtsZ